MERTFLKYKWISLISFALMYCFVYLGRFNLNNLMDHVAVDLDITVGQQNLISMSVFVSYALGSFINGYLADKYGAKRMVIIGGIMTSLINVGVIFQTGWESILIMWFINGYFQSMIWVGGISLLSNWWKEGERGKGIGIANFFSGMSHAVAFMLPIMVISMFPAFGWKGSFVIPISILLIFVLLFAVFAKEKPETVGLEPYDSTLERHRVRERELQEIRDEGRLPYGYFFGQGKFIWWCCIAMLSSICRYGLLNWIPLYYERGSEAELLSETFSNLTLPVGMAFGTLVITWVTGTKFADNKGIAVIAMAAICGTLVVVFPMINNTQTVLVGIFFTGFVLYGINGILWVHAIDQGCRVFAGTAAGILNGFAYLGAFLESFIFPTVMRIFHSYISVFVVMEVLCLCMVICGMFASKKDTIIEPEIRE